MTDNLRLSGELLYVCSYLVHCVFGVEMKN